MNTPRIFDTARAAVRRIAPALVGCAALGASMVACATTQAFNPSGLAAADLARVTDICQNVMGLSPSEPLAGGYWKGADNLDFWSNHYRGCVTSLSESAHGIATAAATQVAEAACRARGLTGGPDLSLCVLQETDRHTAAAAALTVANAPAAASPFLSASNGEVRRREQLACAALGLDPAGGAFQGCVGDLKRTFFALENPIT